MYFPLVSTYIFSTFVYFLCGIYVVFSYISFYFAWVLFRFTFYTDICFFSICSLSNFHRLFLFDYLLFKFIIYPTYFFSFTLIAHFYTIFSDFLSLFSYFLFFFAFFLYLLQMSVLSIPICIPILLLCNYFFSTQFIYHFNLFFFLLFQIPILTPNTKILFSCSI